MPHKNEIWCFSIEIKSQRIEEYLGEKIEDWFGNDSRDRIWGNNEVDQIYCNTRDVISYWQFIQHDKISIVFLPN